MSLQTYLSLICAATDAQLDRYTLNAIFALSSLPFIVLSRSLIITIIWSLLALAPMLPPDYLQALRVWALNHVYGFMLVSGGFALASYGLKYAYNILATYHIALLKAIAFWLRIFAYLFLFIGGVVWGLTNCPFVLLMYIGKLTKPEPLWANLFIFAFLLWQVGYALATSKANSFARNASLVAVWIFVLSMNSFEIESQITAGLWIVGLGGVILGIVELTKSLFSYIASMRAAQENLTVNPGSQPNGF